MENKYLTIIGHKSDDNADDNGDLKFVAQVNPSSIKVSHQISYSGDKGEPAPAGGQAQEKKSFKKAEAQKVSFELLLDATGVIPGSGTGGDSISKQVEKFKQTCYYYKGEVHEPPHVSIHWNGYSLFSYDNIAFLARIESFDVTYTLFTPEGDPIRAKISASFAGTMENDTDAKVRGDESPDLTHIVTVKQGDSLPLLCRDIYGDRQMYHEIARVNQLLSFRHLEPGTELIFPPIK